MMKYRMFLLSFCMALSLGACAGENSDYKSEPFVPLVDIPRLKEPPKLDGVVNKNEWAGSAALDNFLAPTTTNSAAPATKCRVGFDDQNLYIAFRCEVASNTTPQAKIKKHDGSVWSDDSIEIFIWPDGAKSSYDQLVVNSIGTRFDTKCSFDPVSYRKTDEDGTSWNPEWEAATAAEKDAWTMEMAIPWKSLEIEPKGIKGFRLNICRNAIPSPACHSSWAYLPAPAFHMPDRFGIGICCFDPEKRQIKDITATGLGMAGLLSRVKDEKDGGKRFVIGLFSTADVAKDVASNFVVTCRFESTDFDKGTEGKWPESPEISKTSGVKSYIYPSSGLAFHRRSLLVKKVAPGRYYFERSFHGLKQSPSILRYYGGIDWSGTSVSLMNAQPTDQTNMLKTITQDAWHASPKLDDHYVAVGNKISGRIFAGVPADAWFDWSEQAANASKNGKTFISPYGLRLMLYRQNETNNPVWQQDVSLQPCGTAVSIPATNLVKGVYTLDVLARDPEGKTHKISSEWKSKRGTSTMTPDVPVVVLEKLPAPLPSAILTTNTNANAPVLIGNPARKQFPKDDMPDCQARSVHDLHFFEDRIYVGSGDWNRNRGPIQIWSFAADAEGPETEFTEEFTVDDESVDIFRDYNGKLYVPGIDSADKVDDQWALGNLYIKEKGKWSKLRTVPNGIHVLDVAALGKTLYVSTGTETGAGLFASHDDGQTWIRCQGPGAQEGRFYEILPIKETLFVTGFQSKLGAYQCRDTTIERLFLPLATGYTGNRDQIYRLKQYGAGSLYTLFHRWGEENSHQPLYWLSDLKEGARLIEAFKDKQVRDIVVRGKVCYVLCGSPEKQGDARESASFIAQIFSSADLKDWILEAEAKMPALPNSLEVTDKVFFIGLANSRPWQSADVDSGNIYRLSRINK